MLIRCNETLQRLRKQEEQTENMEQKNYVARHPYEGKKQVKIRKVKRQNSLQVMKIL